MACLLASLPELGHEYRIRTTTSEPFSFALLYLLVELLVDTFQNLSRHQIFFSLYLTKGFLPFFVVYLYSRCPFRPFNFKSGSWLTNAKWCFVQEQCPFLEGLPFPEAEHYLQLIVILFSVIVLIVIRWTCTQFCWLLPLCLGQP